MKAYKVYSRESAHNFMNAVAWLAVQRVLTGSPEMARMYASDAAHWALMIAEPNVVRRHILTAGIASDDMVTE